MRGRRAAPLTPRRHRYVTASSRVSLRPTGLLGGNSLSRRGVVKHPGAPGDSTRETGGHRNDTGRGPAWLVSAPMPSSRALPAVAAYSSPAFRKLKVLSGDTIRWSATRRPMVSAASTTARVITLSCSLGSTLPLGWLCASTKAAA